MTHEAAHGEACAEHGSEGRLDSFDHLLRRVAQLCDSDIDRIAVPAQGEVVGGKYRVDAQLAVGGMGAVLRATHVVSGKVVALKWLLPTADRAAARFLREVRAAARVDHPNVVDVYDLGTHRGGHYLVMELLHGRSLGARLRAGQLVPAELVKIMIPVLRGLAAAHARGVIHRDLKPDNVFLCEGPDGTPREPKVLDFGISKLREGAEDAEALTGSGAGIGTPAYMPPEQRADARSVDERADIYAAGVIMYEALTGRLPCHAERPNAHGATRVRRRPTVRAFEPDVPIALQRIVLKALATVASDRQQSADALVHELSTWMSLEGIRTPLQRRSNGPRWSLRALGALFVLVSLMIVALVVDSRPQSLPSEHEHDEAAVAAHVGRVHPLDVGDPRVEPTHPQNSPAMEAASEPRQSARDDASPGLRLRPARADARSQAIGTELSEVSPRGRAQRKTTQPLLEHASGVMPRAGTISLQDM